MAAKTSKLTTKTTKSNVARGSSLKKSRRFDLRIVALIGVVLVAAVGFLFVRLSQAAVEPNCTTGTTGQNCKIAPSKFVGDYGNGRLESKNGGTQYWTASANAMFHVDDIMTSGYVRSYCVEAIFIKAGSIEINSVNQSNGVGNKKTQTAVKGEQYKICNSPVQYSAAGGGDKVRVRTYVTTNADVLVYKVVNAYDPSKVTWTDAVVGGALGGANPVRQSFKQETTQTGPKCDNQTYKPGSRGDCVTLIQARLTDLKYAPGTVDGIYGNKTEAAVSAFQKKNGMTATGQVNPTTWTRLFASNAAAKQ